MHRKTIVAEINLKNLKKNNKLQEIPIQGIKKKFKNLLSAISGFCVLGVVLVGCTYINLVVAANSENYESQRWGKNLLISLFQDIFVNQVLKLLLTLYILKRLNKRKRKKCVVKFMRFFIDKLAVRALAIAFIKPTPEPNSVSDSSVIKPNSENPNTSTLKNPTSFFSDQSPLKHQSSIFNPNQSKFFSFNESNLSNQEFNMELQDFDTVPNINANISNLVEAKITNSTDLRPIQTRSVELKRIETGPTATSSVDFRRAGMTPVEFRPTDVGLGDFIQADTTPVAGLEDFIRSGTTPVEFKPIETGPTATSSIDFRRTGMTPVEFRPTDVGLIDFRLRESGSNIEPVLQKEPSPGIMLNNFLTPETSTTTTAEQRPGSALSEKGKVKIIKKTRTATSILNPFGK